MLMVGLYTAFFALVGLATSLAAFEAGGAALFLERLPWIGGISAFMAGIGTLPVGLFYVRCN